MKFNISLFLFIIISFSASAQQISILKTIEIPAIEHVSSDSYHNIYIADEKENVLKYSPEGEYLLTYSPSKQADISLIDASNSLRIFLYNKDFQQITFLDRFLTVQNQYRFNEDMVGFARSACPSSDNNAWIIDDIDFSLKKIDLQFDKILTRSPLDLLSSKRELDVVYMKEYQFNVYVLLKNQGIMVFDNLGNYRKMIPILDVDSFSFFEDELCYIKDGKLNFFHLYNFTNRELLLTQGVELRKVIVSSKYLYLFSKTKLLLCQKDI